MARHPHGNPTYRKTVTLRGLMASLVACMALVTGVAWAKPPTMPGITFELRTETRCRHMAEATDGLTLVEEFRSTNGIGDGQYELSVALHLRDDNGKDLGILKLDGKEVTVTEVVTPDAVGDMSVPIILDATSLEGQTLVAFATLSRDGSVIARIEDIGDEQQTVHLPKVTATFAAQDGTAEAVGVAQTTLNARVSWSNVRPDAGLRAIVMLVDADTGEPLRDANGREVTSLPMFPQDDDGKMTESGTIDIPVAFDGRAHLGRRVTALARLVHDGKTIASEAEPDAVGTVSLPRVTSTLTESESGLQLAEATSETSVTETVSYEALTPGTTYVVASELADAKTGNYLADADGNALEGTAATRELTPMEASGTVVLSYTIDTLSMAGTTIAARTTLARKSDGKIIASANEATIRLPRMTAEVSGLHTGLPCELADTEAGARVTVCYENLEPGIEYAAWATAHLTGNDSHGNATDEGILHSADGSDATASIRFVPEDEDGSAELTLPFDGSSLEGRRVAVTACISCEGTDIATCSDIAEPSQTLCVPKVVTRDLRSTAGIDEIPADATAQVMASVSYDALPAGSYTAVLALVDPETGEDATNERPSTTFEANGEDGDIDLEWSVDTTGLTGRTLSTITHLMSSGVVIAADYGSEKLYVPTMAADLHDGGSGSQMALAQKETRLEGAVTVSGISPGATHEVRGTLIDAETEMELTDGDGNPITSSSTISHGISGGSATVAFTLDARKFAGRDVCARYELVHDGFVVATKTITGGKAGTVYLPILTLEARSEASGDHELPADGRQKAVTKLDYANVLPGMTYHLVATLVDAESGAPVKSGKALISAEADVAPSSTNGTAELILDCGETAGLAGRGLAVTAVMELGGRTIATADEAKAGSQALRVPSIATTLHAKDGSHEVTTARDVRLVDTITYSNLIPGVEYTVEGELVDASTGKPAIRVVRTESQASSQGTSTGQAKSSEAAKDSFEGKEDATTVWVSEDSTYHLDDRCASATGSLRRTTLGIAKAAGKSPCATESGKAAKVTGTSKAGTTTTTVGSAATKGTATEEEVPVTAKATFTPAEASGIVEVEFPLDATGLEGKKLVALETLKRDKHTVATHLDTGDAEQTVTVTNGADGQGTSAESMGQTGVGGGLVLSIVAGITLAVIGFELLVRHGSPSESDDGSSEHTDDGATDGHR